MRKILLASVAAIPLLSVGMLPAAAQQLKEKSGGVSQSQGAGDVKEKSPARGQVGESGTKGSEGSAAKVSGAPERSQDRTEGRAPAGRQTVGQDQKGRAGDNQANSIKSKAQDQTKSQQGKNDAKSESKSESKSADQSAQPRTKSGDQAKAKNQAGSAKESAKDQSQPSGSARNQSRDNQSKPQQSTGSNQKGSPTTTGQSTRTQSTRTNDQNRASEQNGRSEQGSSQARADAHGSVTLNDQQRTRINETILSRRDTPRMDRVDFDVEVGRSLPREVRVREVPRELVEIYPEWRGDEFFVVRDEIIIVDRSRRIVAHVPVGKSSSTVERRGTSTTTVVEDLSPDDIRRIQLVLIDKGFYHGEADGRLGPEFKDALITFQRREGIEATGRIDERTMTSLGVSIHTEGRAGDNREGGSQGSRDVNDQKSGQNNPAGGNERPSTSGQAGGQGNTPQGNAQQAPGSRNDQNRSESNPSGQMQQRPSTSGQGPSTSGQGGTSSSQSPTSGQQGGPTFTPTQNQPSQNQPTGQGSKGGAGDTQRKQP
jgi:hypothetical protein